MRIISGGQTGVDQAALDTARELGLDYGGFIPRGRWTEDGPLAAEYEGMVEAEGKSPSARTKRNVASADATLIISRGPCEGGTGLTLLKARSYGKPHLHIDLSAITHAGAVAAIRGWLDKTVPATLNVAGPRASKDADVYGEAKAILLEAFKPGQPTEGVGR